MTWCLSTVWGWDELVLPHAAAAGYAFQGIGSSGVAWEGALCLLPTPAWWWLAGCRGNKERLEPEHASHVLSLCVHSTHGHLHHTLEGGECMSPGRSPAGMQGPWQLGRWRTSPAILSVLMQTKVCPVLKQTSLGQVPSSSPSHQVFSEASLRRFNWMGTCNPWHCTKVHCTHCCGGNWSHWGLPREGVQSPSLEVFKRCVEAPFRNMV